MLKIIHLLNVDDKLKTLFIMLEIICKYYSCWTGVLFYYASNNLPSYKYISNIKADKAKAYNNYTASPNNIYIKTNM